MAIVTFTNCYSRDGASNSFENHFFGIGLDAECPELQIYLRIRMGLRSICCTCYGLFTRFPGAWINRTDLHQACAGARCAQFLSGRIAEINDAPLVEGSPVINTHNYLFSCFDVSDLYIGWDR